MLVCKQNDAKWYIQQRDLMNLFCRRLANVLSLSLPLHMLEMCAFFNELRLVFTLRKIQVITSFIYFYFLFYLKNQEMCWLVAVDSWNKCFGHLFASFFSAHFSCYLSCEDSRGGFYYLSNNADICGLFTGKGVFWDPEREPSNAFIWLYAFRKLAEQGALIMINNAAIFPHLSFHLFLIFAFWDGLQVIVNMLGAV